MNTEARRRASAAFHAKRTAEGYRKVTLWLSPDALMKLELLRLREGSKDKAAEAALLACEVRTPVIVKTPPAAQKTAKAPKLPDTSRAKVTNPGTASVPTFERKRFNPQPKTGKKR